MKFFMPQYAPGDPQAEEAYAKLAISTSKATENIVTDRRIYSISFDRMIGESSIPLRATVGEHHSKYVPAGTEGAKVIAIFETKLPLPEDNSRFYYICLDNDGHIPVSGNIQIKDFEP